MNYVIVKLTAALVCFTAKDNYACYPALIGPDTPAGLYTLTHYLTEPPDFLYGGDLLVFKEDNDDVWAIHRVINVPGQHRIQRLKANDVSKRRNITNGCINIEPEVYEKLVDCCSNSELYIIP